MLPDDFLRIDLAYPAGLQGMAMGKARTRDHREDSPECIQHDNHYDLLLVLGEKAGWVDCVCYTRDVMRCLRVQEMM